jgi:bifunctional non-homologous end joining protein LigD
MKRMAALLPRITPATLGRRRDPFDHPEWLFELKWDGFRAVAYVAGGACRLVSRNDREFRAFPGLCDSVAAAIGRHSAVLDGEIVCLDASGRAQFNPLLYRRGEPHYYAFDCMWLDGRDLRDLPLIERKRVLRTLIPRQPSSLLYVSHICGSGVDLFREVCRRDLEGIVAKHKNGLYASEPDTWIKIKNPNYSQTVGRHERFEQRRG